MVFCTTIFSTNQNLPPICNYPSFPAKIKLKLKFGSGYFQNLPNLNGFYVKDIDGNDVPLSKFNVASKCGLTSSNYSELSQVYAKYKPQGMPGALSVKRDPDVNSVNEDYSYNFNLEENSVPLQTVLLYPDGFKHWLVCVEKPSSRAFSKAQTVDFYVDILTKVLRNEKDAQMCLYHTSLHSDFYGFCCILDEECAKELAAVPGVLSVQPDENFESENKDYGGGRLSPNAPTSVLTDMSKTKLFITGLSFYTSEKTLRAAFEPFGELIEVKIIMDKISKRSKGYAFVEFTSEDAATTALREMNGKIINGWMIVVDRARANPRLSRRS